MEIADRSSSKMFQKMTTENIRFRLDRTSLVQNSVKQTKIYKSLFIKFFCLILFEFLTAIRNS